MRVRNPPEIVQKNLFRWTAFFVLGDFFRVDFPRLNLWLIWSGLCQRVLAARAILQVPTLQAQHQLRPQSFLVAKKKDGLLPWRFAGESGSFWYLGDSNVPTTPPTLIFLQKYRHTNGSRIVIQIGGVYTTFCQEEGILLQKYRDRNGSCIAILFKSIGVRGRCDSPELQIPWPESRQKWSTLDVVADPAHVLDNYHPGRDRNIRWRSSIEQ